VPPVDREGPREEGKRRAYIIALVLGLVFLIASGITPGDADPFMRVMRPVLLVHTAALLLGVWSRRLPLRIAESLLFLGACAGLLGVLLAWRLELSVAPVDLAVPVGSMVWVGVLFPLAFLMFGTRRGTQVSLAAFGVFLALVGPPALGDVLVGREETPLTSRFIELATFHATLIALLWVLAGRLERLVAARTEARMLAAQARTDPLTGIANRRQLDDELDRLIAQARRHGHPLSAVLIDLDRFKDVNDRLGHEAGDHALVAVTRRLTASIRGGDLLGRWGGEEFLLVAPETDHAAALELAERCRRRISAEPLDEAGELTASFGVATLGADDDRRTLLRRADLALYTAKSEGRDRVVGIADVTDTRDVEAPREASGRHD
jgi:diguanylate cyclase